jgi:hypothetical protein
MARAESRRAHLGVEADHRGLGRAGERRLRETLAIETANGLVVALYAVRNPDKVRHLA